MSDRDESGGKGGLQESGDARLMLFISSLSLGGAQKVFVAIANHLASRGFHVCIATFADPGEESFFELDGRVEHRCMGLLEESEGVFQKIFSNVRRVRAMRREVLRHRATHVLSFMDTTNVLSLIATRGLNVRTWVSERSDPSRNPLSRVWKLLRNLIYPLADGIVFQTKRAKLNMKKLYARALVIPNPVDQPDASTLLEMDARARKVIGVGRLSEEKGFDALLRSFAKLKDEFSEWNLEIWGDGPELGGLESLIGELGLETRAELKGSSNALENVLTSSSVFVLSSRFEGFPNALCEAMASGCACVSFNCVSGPAEIIDEGSSGLLVDPASGVGGLADAMRRVMGDFELRESMGREARKSMKCYAHDEIMSQWEKLFR